MPIHTDLAAAPGLPAILLPFARRTPPDASAAGDDAEPRRFGRVVAFPPPPAERCRLMAQLASAVAERLTGGGHVELFDAAADLLALDDPSFAARLRLLSADEAGRALLDELCAAVRCAAVDFDRGSRVLFVLSARLNACTAGGGAHG